MNQFVYDLETLYNIFTFSGKFVGKPEIYTFEISSRKNQRTELLQFLEHLKQLRVTLVGYNNLGFDYVIIHELLNNPYTFTYQTACNLCQSIINSQRFGEGGQFWGVRLGERILPQLDLYKINHFDNKNKATSLKALQFAMRLQNVEDMPVKLGVNLTHEEMDKVIHYNHHDITSTEAFLLKNTAQIKLRQDLLDTGTLKGDVLNFSDVKIGTEYLISKIGRSNCFLPGNKPKKTFREKIVFSEIILPKIRFKTEPYQAVLDWFMQQVKYVLEEGNPALEVKLAGLDFKFGVGGIHASVESQRFDSDDEFVIKDIDITGAYVATAIVNGFSPEHLKDFFPKFYKQLQTDRAQYKKGTTMNAVLKLAGNGIFGNSDNKFSCFYDPKYAKQTTVNCQLFILELVEMLDLIPQLQIIQANTDGITARFPRRLEYLFNLWKKVWENDTGLRLEEVEYKTMWVRDVNNYMALTVDGKIKRKGAYWYPEEDKDYDGVWNKDFSMMCVPKIIGEVLVNGWNPEALVRLMHDPFDFMIRYKTPSGSKVFIGDQEMAKTVRYYVSTAGKPMKKISIPRGVKGTFCRANSLKDDFYNKTLSETPTEEFTLPTGEKIIRHIHNPKIHTKNKSTYDEVHTSIESGFLIKCCNNSSDFNWNDVDYNYYSEQIKKLII